MRAFRVQMPSGQRYWTVLDDELHVVPVADRFLRELRFGRDRAESTTKSSAGGVALFLRWCQRTPVGTSSRGHRRDRPALPGRTRPTPGPPHDHQDDPHPAAPLHDLRPRPTRPQRLTWVIRQTEDRKRLDLRKPERSLKIFGNSG